MTELVASPLTCVLEHALQGQHVERALFCTFTFDAGYFERIALSPLDAVGAQITVIADAQMALLDPYAARRAGTRYGLGLVHHSAAFHPKLFVLLGEDHCTIGIGSANVTAAGWHQSEELWTVISATADSIDAAIPDTGRWLTSLAATATLGPRAAQTVTAIGRRLTEMTATDGAAQVISNLDRPILEQLPSQPVDELNLYAPFHGHNARAAAALCERFQPSVLRIGFQPELTSLDPTALFDFTNTFAGDVELRALSADRYRHGKLIEWRIAGGWQSLTGSPNLSHAALLSTPARGGNYELAVLTANDASLLPAADAAAPEGAFRQLRGAEPQPPDVTDSGPRILEAVLDGDIVELTLTQPAPYQVAVQAAPAGQPPEQWTPWGEVPDGSARAELDPLGGGSWLRVVGPTGDASPAAVVLGPTTFRLRHGRGAATSAQLPSIDELFTDTNAASRFFHHLVALNEQLTSNLPPTASTGGGSSGGPGVRRHESWDEYLDRVSGHLGENLLRFSLGLSLTGQHASGGANWDDEDIDDSEAALDDDTAEDLADITARLVASPDMTGLTEAMRQRLVRQLTDLASGSHLNEPILRLLALRLTLAFLAGGAWPPGDDSWVEVLLAHVDRLAAEPSDEPQIRRRQGALAALSLSVCRAEVPRVPETVLSSRISRSTARASGLIDSLDPDDLEAYCSDLGERLGFRAQPDGVIDFALAAVGSTPFSTAVQSLAALDEPVEAIDQAPVLVLPEPFTGNHLQRALLPLKLLGDAGDVAIQIGTAPDAHVVVWAEPVMVHLRYNPRGPVADVYRFHSGSGPAGRQGTSDLPRSARVMGPNANWTDVDAALERVGLSR